MGAQQMLQNITSGSYKSLEAQQVGNVPVITERWRDQVLYEWNNSRAYFPNACTHELLEQQVAREPQRSGYLLQG
jgi:hypothetical protein